MFKPSFRVRRSSSARHQVLACLVVFALLLVTLPFDRFVPLPIAGVTPSAAERQAAIDEFAGAATSADASARARSLRLIIQNSAFLQREFPRAFVQMQYFGYLRRNPDDLPDGNFNGYNFWLNKLNQFNGNYIEAEMVKAFISSFEYRGRFGQ